MRNWSLCCLEAKMPRVLNKRTDKIPSGAICVDRSSKYGNPFKMGKGKTRKEVLMMFRVYAVERLLREPHWLDELKGDDVMVWCWCAPLPCHADILLELANGIH